MLKYLGDKKAMEEKRNDEVQTPSAATILEVANALTALQGPPRSHSSSPASSALTASASPSSALAPSASATVSTPAAVPATQARPTASSQWERRTDAASAASAEAERRHRQTLRRQKHRAAASVACDRNASFPERLMAVLSDPDASTSVSWLPDGLSFVVTSPQKLTLEILPRYFGQTEFASFTRKLYWWGFKKTSRSKSAAAGTAAGGGAMSSAEADSYRHELFQRDRPELASKMRGAQVKRNRNAAKAAAAAAGTAAKKSVTQKPEVSVRRPQQQPLVSSAPSSAPSRAPAPSSSSPLPPSLMAARAQQLATATANNHNKLVGGLTDAERHRALLLKSSNAFAAASLLRRSRMAKTGIGAAAAASLRTSSLLAQSAAQQSAAKSGATGQRSSLLPDMSTVADLPLRYAQLLAERTHMNAKMMNGGTSVKDLNCGDVGGAFGGGGGVSAQAFYANALQQRQQQRQRVRMQALAAAQALHQNARRQQQLQQNNMKRTQEQMMPETTRTTTMQRGLEGPANSSQAPVVIHVHHHHLQGGKSYTTVSRNQAA